MVIDRRTAEKYRPGRYPHFLNWPANRDIFKNPPDDFRPAAYWFWSREVNTEDFRSKLQEMRDAGLVSFWIQPRLGYPIEKYLSEEYFVQYRAALDIAAELDMYVGIYDDYNWITGHCGGRTVKGHDEFRESQIFWVEVPLENGLPQGPVEISGIKNLLAMGHKEAMPWLYEGGEYCWGEWKLLRAFTYERDQQILCNTVKNVTGQISLDSVENNNCKFTAEGSFNKEATHLMVVASARCLSSRMIDYLSYGAVKRFIEVGYDPYYENLQDYWDMIWAMFIDEPYTGLYRWDQMTGDLGTALMYNEDFLQEFQKNRGYDILDRFYALIFPAGSKTDRWRSQFYESYAERVQRTFFAQLRAWCNEHGVRLVGHELMTQLNGHWGFTTTSGFDVVANFGADYFGMGRFKDTSVTDSGSFDKNLSAKLASSIAHVLGKNGSMLEQYTPGFETDKDAPSARGDWNVSAHMVKHQMDFYALQGLSQFLWHGYFQSNDTTEDNRALYSQRFDFPPGINYEPWFRYFNNMAQRNARLAYFLSLGKHKAPAAVLYPLRTYWSKGRAHLFSREGAFLNENLNRLQCDYDLVDEENLLEAEIEDGALVLRDERYELLVLPAVSTLQDERVVEKIEDFARAGGAILFSGGLPNATQAGGQDESISKRLRDLVGGRVVYLETPLSEMEDGLAVLDSVLTNLGVRSLHIMANDVREWGTFYCLREDSHGYYLGILSDGAEEKAIQVVLPDVWGLPELWDIDTGETSPWVQHEQTKEGLVISLTLPPWGVGCLRIKKGCSGLQLSTNGKVVRSEQQAAGEWIISLEVEDNQACSAALRNLPSDSVLSIIELGKEIPVDLIYDKDTVQFQIPHRKLPDGVSASSSWDLVTEDGRTLAVSSDCGWEKQGLSDYSGGATYSQIINIPEELVCEHLRLVPSSVYHTMEVKLNGEEQGVRAWPPYELPIGNVKPGMNKVEVFVTNTAGNAMYDGTHYDVEPKALSGIVGPVRLKPYRLITLKISNP